MSDYGKESSPFVGSSQCDYVTLLVRGLEVVSSKGSIDTTMAVGALHDVMEVMDTNGFQFVTNLPQVPPVNLLVYRRPRVL